MLAVAGKADYDYVTYRFSCTTSYEPNVEEKYRTRNYMYATFTNDTQETVYNIEIVLALLDAEENILYMDKESLYNDVGVAPGSTITIRKDVSSSFIEYFEINDLVPATVDAIAYVYMEQK